MKALSNYFILASFCGIRLCDAQQITTGQSLAPSSTPYSIVANDANSRIWERTIYKQRSNGQVVAEKQRYTELATGLNHLVNGQWVESKERIDILPDGTAAATNGQHQAYFPANIYNGEIRLVTPDGINLYSRPVGLSYDDGTNTVLIAVLTNSVGELVSSNTVIYPNAFVGINADLKYVYTIAGFEQDVVLHQQAAAPAAFGLDSTNTHLQVLTEFINSSQPTYGNAGDDNLYFGDMRMRYGKAFLIRTNSASVPVNKKWMQINGRQILVEDVPLSALAVDLHKLPMASVQMSGIQAHQTLLGVASATRLLPPQHLAKASHEIITVAMGASSRDGLVLDYQTVSGSLANYTFQSDTTYYISANVYLTGSSTFEGGTVIKYNYDTIYVDYPATIKTLASSYRPVIFTSGGDTTVGASTPSGSGGNPALAYYGANAPYQSFLTLTNFRIYNCNEAIYVENCLTATFKDAQLVDCGIGFEAPGYSVIANFQNVLFGDIYQWDFLLAQTTVNCVNVTLDGDGDTALSVGDPEGSAEDYTLNMTNCLIGNVWTFASSPGGYVIIHGDYNGFYDNEGVSDFGTHHQDSSLYYPYEHVRGGYYYLPSTSSFRGGGTTSIDPVLLADLRSKTTQPPVVYADTFLNPSSDFSPQGLQDTGTDPDLGFHYDVLDYLFQNCDVGDNYIIVDPGTAIGWQGQGIYFDSESGYGLEVYFDGMVGNPCYFVRANTVQESDTSGDNIGFASSDQIINYYILFTRFSALGDLATFFDADTTEVDSVNSEFWDGQLANDDSDGMDLFAVNCLFDRTAINIPESLYEGYSSSLSMQNCTVHGGSVTAELTSGYGGGYVEDTAFDQTVISISNPSDSTTYFLYNAYQSGYDKLPMTYNVSSEEDVSLSGSFNWQSGLFGNFYAPSGSPLIDADGLSGDRLAADIVPVTFFGMENSLANFTITDPLDQTPDTGPVDIGYHYPVLTANNGNLSTCPNTDDSFLFSSFNNGWNMDGYDNDIWGLPVTYTVKSLPADGTLTEGSWDGGEFYYTYTPNLNYSGSDSFTYELSDGAITTAVATISVNVLDPTANPQTTMTATDQPVNITLTGSYGCGGSLSYAIVSGHGPSHGTISGTLPNITYQPSAGYEGMDTFEFDVTSGLFTSPPATVTNFVVGGPILSIMCDPFGPDIGLHWTPDSTVQSLIANDGFAIKDYLIYRSTASGGPYTLIFTTTDTNQTSYFDSDVTSGDTYYYVITYQYEDSYTSTVYMNTTANPDFSTTPTPGEAPYSNQVSAEPQTSASSTLIPATATWQVINISDPASPTTIGSLQAPFGDPLDYASAYPPPSTSPLLVPVNSLWADSTPNTYWSNNITLDLTGYTSAQLSQVMASVAVDNNYSLYVNGHAVVTNQWFYTAVWTSFQTLPYLVAGSNQISVVIWGDNDDTDYFSAIVIDNSCGP